MTKAELEQMIRDIVGDAVTERQKMLTLAGAATPARGRENHGGETTKPRALVGSLARALAAGKGDVNRASEEARRFMPADMADAVVRALEGGAFDSEGFLVPEVWATEVIELLRPRVAVRAMNPRVVPLDDGNLTIPKLTAGATSGYVGEARAREASAPELGQVKLSAKTLVGVVPVPNGLIRSKSAMASELVEADLADSLAETQDQAFLRGDGTDFTPRGLRSWAHADNFISGASGGDLNKILSALRDALAALASKDCKMLNVGWIMNPVVKWALMFLRDSNGNFLFKEEMSKGTLLGFPFADTTNIPANLGSGADSEVILADFADVVIGDMTGLLLQVSDTAAWESGGQVFSAISRDVTVVKALVAHDLIVRHSESVAVITDVDWYQ